jgi:hypothetical protein
MHEFSHAAIKPHTAPLADRPMSRLWPIIASAIAITLLSACGGGGGGNPSPSPAPPPASTDVNPPAQTPLACTVAPEVAIANPPAATAGSGQVVVSGTAKAQTVGNNLATGALDYANLTLKPIRHAVVEILNSATQALLATTETSDTGTYSAAVAQNTNVIVRIKAQTQRITAPTWNVMVRDNTSGNALYALDSAAFNTGAANVTKDLTAASGWNGTAYSGTRASGPFAVLDTMYTAIAKTRTASGAAAFPDLNVYWSINNVSASPTNIPAGQIATTYFSYDGTNRSIYVLGKADNDTDEFDESVIAHEWGHYFQNVFSRDDSVGGSHGGGDLLDMRVAFSEGWGNAWSGIALNRSKYTDSNGAAQGKGFALTLSQGSSKPGWYKEDSVQYIVYSLNQQLNFAPIWLGMACQMPNGTPVSSIFSFASSLKSSSPSSSAAINTLLQSQTISGVDEWGNNETNTGGAIATAPLYKQLAVGTARNVCLSTSADISNKLGNYAFLWFSTDAARSYTITVTGGSDPDFDIFQNGYLKSAISATQSSETASVSLKAGQAVVALGDAALAKGSSPCFSVLVQ